MKRVYFISGLGGDKRAFKYLDLSFCEAHFVEWLPPLPKETLTAYAERLFSSDIKDEHAIVVGLSFGGMLATEIARNHPGVKAIIISSAKTSSEIPAYLRFWKHVPIYKLYTERTRKFAKHIATPFFSARAPEHKKMVQRLLRESNPAFTAWAIDAILKWKNDAISGNVIHIHGSLDKLLPHRYVQAHHTIDNGNHLLVMDFADEVSALLKKLITG